MAEIEKINPTGLFSKTLDCVDTVDEIILEPLYGNHATHPER